MKPDDLCRKISNYFWSKSKNLEWEFKCFWTKCTCPDCDEPIVVIEWFPYGVPAEPTEKNDVRGGLQKVVSLQDVVDAPDLEKWCNGIWDGIVDIAEELKN